MNKQFTSTGISIRLWLFTSLFMAGGVAIGTLFAGSGLFALPVFIVGSIIALIVSLPALAILCLFIPAIKNAATDVHSKCLRLVILLAVISMGYAVIPAAVSIFRWLNFY
jgi:hypothetical protein